jgi:hypothetical protein
MPTFLATASAIVASLAGPGNLDGSGVVSKSIDAPRLEVTVGGQPPPVEEIWLDVPGQAPIRASEIQPDREPIVMALVYCGQAVWIGTSQYREGDDGFAGVLPTLEESIDAAHVADRWPRGSKAIAISYGTGARIELPMQSIERFSGSALGHESDYRDNLGSDLIAGVERGFAALEAEPIRRRLLVVIGDGNDTNNQTAAPRLRQLAARALRSNIDIMAIISRSELSPDGNIISSLTSQWSTAESAASLRAELERIVASRERYVVEFSGVRLDGVERDVKIHAGSSSAPLRLSLGTHCRFGSTSGEPPWMIIVVFAIGLISIATGRAIVTHAS